MSDEKDTSTQSELTKFFEEKEYDAKTFLETVPPGKKVIVSNFSRNYQGHTVVNTPQLKLHCTGKDCKGMRFFDEISNPIRTYEDPYMGYLKYICQNCRTVAKIYSLHAVKDTKSNKWKVIKFGEMPSFGPPTPSKASKLIQGEKKLFILGRKCENQGMGIGAFVYYRRVIESQKNQIFDKMIRIIEKISPGNEVIEELKAAKEQPQFTRAVESINKALPDSLLLNGHNPLTLLHSALSAGVHEHDDAKCLELANDVRAVLFEFAERLGQALKEDTELNSAISRLAKKG